MGRINHNVIDNGDVEVHPSEFPFESNSESVPDTDTTVGSKEYLIEKMKKVEPIFYCNWYYYFILLRNRINF